MISETLQRLIDQDITTAKEISELTGVASSTVYRWISGKSQPDFNAIRMLVRHLPHIRGQEAILTAFTAGTPWKCFHIDTHLDVNLDGIIDRKDAMQASIESVRTASESLSQLRGALDQLPTEPNDSQEVIHLLDDVIRHCSIVQRILVRLADHTRKSAKPAT